MITPAERTVMKATAKAMAQQMFLAAMTVGKNDPLHVGVLFVTMTYQLAFARVLEEQLLKTLALCPDGGLSDQVEELAGEIAAELIRESDAKAAKAKVPR